MFACVCVLVCVCLCLSLVSLCAHTSLCMNIMHRQMYTSFPRIAGGCVYNMKTGCHREVISFLSLTGSGCGPIMAGLLALIILSIK